MEVPHFTHPILYEAFIGITDILWKVAEKDELRICCGQLRNIFYFHPLALDRRRRILLFHYGQKHLVELCGRDTATAGFAHGFCCLEHFIYPLFVNYRCENNRHIVKGQCGS